MTTLPLTRAAAAVPFAFVGNTFAGPAEATVGARRDASHR
jgi:hypothetical protein